MYCTSLPRALPPPRWSIPNSPPPLSVHHQTPSIAHTHFLSLSFTHKNSREQLHAARHVAVVTPTLWQYIQVQNVQTPHTHYRFPSCSCSCSFSVTQNRVRRASSVEVQNPAPEIRPEKVFMYKIFLLPDFESLGSGVLRKGRRAPRPAPRHLKFQVY